MFDIGWSELLLIAVVAIVIVGPKDLPPMLRATGRMVSKLRRTAGEFQNQFNEALREAELDGVKDSINEIRALNPMNEIRKSLDPIATAIGKPEPAKPIAVPAPEPVPPPMNQLAQPMAEADLKPAADPMPVAAAAEAGKPVRAKRKPKAETADGAATVAPKKPAAKRAATAAVNGAESPAAAEAVVVKKPRPSRAKAAPTQAAASDVSAPVSENAAAAPAVPPPEERH